MKLYISDLVHKSDMALRDFLRINFESLSSQIEWTNLAVKYQPFINHLLFHLDGREKVKKGTVQAKRDWAMKTLKPGNMDGLTYHLD